MYIVYMLVVSAVLYPIASGLVWSGGLLAQLGFHDFAGEMVIHGLRGLSGLTAAYVIGPRVDRFDADGTVNVIPGHSITLAVLGTLILAFGWYGFNVGTAVMVFSIERGIALADFMYVGRVALNTTLGMIAGGAGAGLVAWRNTGKLDTLYLANGLLAGLVGVTPVADVALWPGAIAVGLLAGAQLPVVFAFVEEQLRIDDVCAVFPVHGSAGVLGILAYPFVAVGVWNGNVAFLPALGAQVAGVILIGGLSVLGTYVLFKVGVTAGWARVSPETEREGLDIGEHGVETYPEFGDHDSLTGGSVVPDGGRSVSDVEMVVAYVRPDQLSEVKRALAEVGAPSLTVSNVSGRGSQPAKKGQWRGEEYTVDLHRKVKVECVVADVPAEDVMRAIADAARTGEKGDGKVFVLPVEAALQIRTGDRGLNAV